MATPTLMVNADADAVMPPSSARILAARIRDVREVLLDDCGHVPMIEQPEAYHRVVRELLGCADRRVQDGDSSESRP